MFDAARTVSTAAVIAAPTSAPGTTSSSGRATAISSRSWSLASSAALRRSAMNSSASGLQRRSSSSDEYAPLPWTEHDVRVLRQLAEFAPAAAVDRRGTAATLRAIAEHQIEAGGISETGRAALRNFRCGPVAWLIFGAYGFAEHATHHREPAIPYYHLSWVTSKLAAVDSELQPRHRYLTEIMTLTGIRTPDKSPKAN